MKIAISGLNNTDNPAPGIPVAKSLEKHSLVGLSYDANEPGIYQGIFEKVYLMPYPSLGYEEFKNRIMHIKNESNIEMKYQILMQNYHFILNIKMNLKN